MGTLFTTMVLSFAAISRGSDITLAPPEALVAGINGVYRTAALIIFTSFLLAATAMWLEKRMSKKIETVKILDTD